MIMTDMEDKYRERWQDKRKKTYDWKRLIIMLLATFAVFVVMDKLNQVSVKEDPAVEYTATDTTRTPQTQNPSAEDARP